jgi:hypothetical protein
MLMYHIVGHPTLVPQHESFSNLYNMRFKFIEYYNIVPRFIVIYIML